jgi:hypothetical protein
MFCAWYNTYNIPSEARFGVWVRMHNGQSQRKKSEVSVVISYFNTMLRCFRAKMRAARAKEGWELYSVGKQKSVARSNSWVLYNLRNIIFIMLWSHWISAEEAEPSWWEKGRKARSRTAKRRRAGETLWEGGSQEAVFVCHPYRTRWQVHKATGARYQTPYGAKHICRFEGREAYYNTTY